MISLEHIRQLQDKVNKAVDHMNNLGLEKEILEEENQLLRSRIDAYENRVAELERFIDEFKSEQTEIEEGIISALKHLDSLEQAVDVLKTEPVTEPSSLNIPTEPSGSVGISSDNPAPTETVIEIETLSDTVASSEIGQGLEAVSFELPVENVPSEEALDSEDKAHQEQELELF